MSSRKRLVLRAVLVLCVAFLGLAVAGVTYSPNTAIPAGFGGRHVTIGDLPIRVLQQGQGRDLLLIHGSPGSVEDFRPLVGALSDSFRLTAFDRPGHGFSGDDGRYSYEHNADIALALIEKLGLKHTIVVGHSYGGGTALAAALRGHPDVDAYVVIDSAVYTTVSPLTPLIYVMAMPWLGTGFARVSPNSVAEGKYREGVRAVFREQYPPSEEFVDLRVRVWSSPKVAHATAAERAGVRGWLRQMSPRYGEIQKPVYILAQAENELRSSEARQLHQQIKGSTLSLVPGTGHYIQFERPDAVIDAIRTAAATAVSAAP